MCAPQVMVWTVLGMFLNPNRVGPFFAAVTGFVFHITSYYNGLTDQFKQAKIKLKEMMVEFRQKVQAEVAAKAKELASRIEDQTTKVVGAVDDFAQDAAAKLGISSDGGDGGDGGAGGSLVVPEFVSQILEDVAMQKIKLQEVPDEVQTRMLELVNAKLDSCGVMDELEFVMEISSLVAKGDHAGVKRVIINKLWELLHALLEAQGFSAALETLFEEARDNVQQTLDQLTKSSAEIVERLVKDELAPRGLAGPASMQPILSAKLKEILRTVIVELASKGPMALQKFAEKMTTQLDQARQTSGQHVMRSGFDMLDSAHEQISNGQLSICLADRLKEGLMLVIRKEAEKRNLLKGLEFAMQMSAVSGSTSYRCWTIANAAFDLLLEHSEHAEQLFDKFLESTPNTFQRDIRNLKSKFEKVFQDLFGSELPPCLSKLQSFLIDPSKKSTKTIDTIKRIQAKYGNLRKAKIGGASAMEGLQQGILEFVREQVRETFKTDLGREKAEKLKTISFIENADEKKAKLSLEIAELRSWAESEVASYWCAIEGTRKRKALIESLSSVLCSEMGTEWEKIKLEEVEGESLTEIKNDTLKGKIRKAAADDVILGEGVKELQVSRDNYIKVDSDYYRPKDGCDEADEHCWGPNHDDPKYFNGAFVWIMHNRAIHTHAQPACVCLHVCTRNRWQGYDCSIEYMRTQQVLYSTFIYRKCHK